MIRLPRISARARPVAGRVASQTAGALLLLALAACHPSAGRAKLRAVPERPIADVLAAHTPELMSLPGVVGTYQGARGDGSLVIVVMIVKRDSVLERRIPRRLEGWPVAVQVTGEIRALPDSAP